MPILILSTLGAIGYTFYSKGKNAQIDSPYNTGNKPVTLNLTVIAGYAIAGGLVYYFGKKLIQA